MEQQLDLQDETRMWDTYDQLQTMIAKLKEVSAFPSLVWLWTWDSIVDKYDSYQSGDEYYKTNTDIPLHEVFKLLWEDADVTGFTLEFGTEDHDESVFDWMVDKNILIDVEADAEDEDADE